jgi:hypothetical protein
LGLGQSPNPAKRLTDRTRRKQERQNRKRNRKRR